MNRAAALRVSLLVSMGLVPIACGGTMLRGSDDDEGGSGSGGSAGSGVPPEGGKSTGKGGTSSRGGMTYGGGITGGGTTSKGGATYGGSGGICHNGELDVTTGLVRCEEGYFMRPQATRCETPLVAIGGAGGESPGPLPRVVGLVHCADDLDCVGFELGYCESPTDGCWDSGAGGQTGFCRSGCSYDEDCGGGFICVCDGSDHGGECVRSSCLTNAECGFGSACASLSSYGELSFACTSPNDTCTSNVSCPAGSFCGQLDVAGSTYRSCVGLAVCGRPFLVESAARLAPVVRDDAWSTPRALSPRLEHLTSSERAAHAAHWAKLGQMEHASIAAFARFSLQLLALGAPPELVQDCTRALADETAHTTLCFGLASAYAGRGIGPGPLDVERSLEVTSLADIVALVIAEGCFGETSAALEALEASDRASDPVIADAYSQIAADEQRHAELAFRFLRWALERDGDVVRACIVAALDAPPAHGALAITVPCLQALLSTLPRSIRAPHLPP